VFNLILAEHDLVVGQSVLSEVRRVLEERIGVPARTIDEFLELLQREGTIVSRTENLPVRVRDKSDLPVLSEAVAGNADALVTGDADLLELAGKLPIQIVSPRGFWEQLRQNNSQP
jgi:putative PIN family toxin of toxin-antitoxin system